MLLQRWTDSVMQSPPSCSRNIPDFVERVV